MFRNPSSSAAKAVATLDGPGLVRGSLHGLFLSRLDSSFGGGLVLVDSEVLINLKDEIQA